MMTASAHVPTAPHYASFEVDQELRLVDGSIVANDEIEIVHELGRGGMSVVYRAVDLADGRREVVLKVANASSSTTTTTRSSSTPCRASSAEHGDRVFSVQPEAGRDAVGKARGIALG